MKARTTGGTKGLKWLCIAFPGVVIFVIFDIKMAISSDYTVLIL